MESGELLWRMNSAVGKWGHGRLETPDGHCLEIGGSTGGLTRKLVDEWKPPSFLDFMEESETIQKFVRGVWMRLHRRARDGNSYTVQEFEHYFKEDWQWYWEEARVQT